MLSKRQDDRIDPPSMIRANKRLGLRKPGAYTFVPRVSGPPWADGDLTWWTGSRTNTRKTRRHVGRIVAPRDQPCIALPRRYGRWRKVSTMCQPVRPTRLTGCATPLDDQPRGVGGAPGGRTAAPNKPARSRKRAAAASRCVVRSWVPASRNRRWGPSAPQGSSPRSTLEVSPRSPWR